MLLPLGLATLLSVGSAFAKTPPGHNLLQPTLRHSRCNATGGNANGKNTRSKEQCAVCGGAFVRPDDDFAAHFANGVRGIVKQTHGTGVVAVQVWVRAGSRFETPSTAGCRT
jgi:tRNA U54 and U55 pseudouridine synthase Pus10